MLLLMRTINNSLDFASIEIELENAVRTVKSRSNQKQLERMLVNIAKQVTELSKLEVQAKRTKSVNLTNDLVVDINQNIENFELFLLQAALIGDE
jgi:hypothetical protein